MARVAKTGTGSKKTGTGTKRKTGTGRKNNEKKKLSEAQLIQANRNAGSLPAMKPEEMDLNKRIIQHSMQTIEISKSADRKDPESLLSCFQNYLTLCLQNGMRVGNIGACTALGITTATLSYWKNGQRQVNDPRYKKLAELIYSVCSMTREELISQGEINPVIGIFWQRNYDGLRNDTEQMQSLQDSNQDEDMTSNEYMKKYGSLITD